MTKAKLPPGVRVRPDGRYEQRLTLDGRRISVYGATPKELAGKVADARRKHAQGRALRASETVATYLTRWLAEVVAPPHRAWRTYTQRRAHIVHHLIPALGHIRLDRLTTADVRQALNAIHRGGRAARTVNHIRTTLTAALNDALREGTIERNAAALVRPFPVPEDDRRPLTADEARALLAALRDDRLYALFALGLLCGLRLGEATGLTWEAVDLAAGELRVVRSLQWQTGGHVLKGPKNRASERTLVLPDAVRDALAAHRDAQARERAHAAAWGNDWGLVFTTRTGRPLHQVTVGTILSRYLAEAGLPRQTFHMLRACAASLLAEKGVPEIEVQALLGHASGKTTRRFYTRSYATGKRRVADAMDTLIAPRSG